MGALPVRVQAPIVALLPETPDTITLRFAAELDYRPGQAVKVLVPGDEKARFFSISSSPTEKGYMAVSIKPPAGSALEQALRQASPGQTVEVEGPYGSLQLPDSLDMPLCFLTGGTGVTPFRAMVRFLRDNGYPTEIWLIHSARKASDLLFKAEFEDWASTSKGRFHYVPTLTGDDPSWKADTGRIREELLKKHVPLQPCCFLLCGPSAFVADTEKLLGGPMQIPVEHIRREQW